MIRLMGGEFRKHDLKTDSLSGKRTRPSLAIVRKSVFSMLGDVSGKRCLDLFAGSGVLGMEALSRGAAFVMFIDRDKDASSLIRRNLEDMNASEKSEVHNTDFRMALKAIRKRQMKFDVVFLDPPYRFTKAYDPAGAVITAELLERGGICVLLSSAQEDVPLENVKILKDKKFTATRITIFTGEKE